MTRAPQPARMTPSQARDPRSGHGRRCRRATDQVRAQSYGAWSLRRSQCGPVWHLALVQPGAEVRLGDAARSRHRALGVLDALAGELANPFLDCGHSLVGGLET